MEETSDEFTSDSYYLLKNILLKRGSELCNAIDKIERKSDADRTYYGYIKSFLVGSGCLCDDIVSASNNGAILLAMIGTRSLLEDTINILYLETITAKADRMRIADEWLATSNDPQAAKHILNGKNVAKRAQSNKGAKTLYYTEYAHFCNYTHGSATRGLLNVPDLCALAVKKTVLASLKAYANITTCVANIVGEDNPQELLDAVNKYLDKYRESVSEASLAIRLPS
jgi:hypothetical protein